MIKAILSEISLRHDYLNEATLDSIYLGGGTPSILPVSDLSRILNHLSSYYYWDRSCEITLEANPDDLNKTKLKEFKSLGINRLSIGIQSFSDNDLQFMNRSHNRKQAINSINLAKALDFNNISIDLIFGSPTTSDVDWENNLIHFLNFEIDHLSCYALTIEPKTVFSSWIMNGKMKDLCEEKSVRQFNMAKRLLENEGFEHYEISNYAKNQKFSKHNTNYWFNRVYCGFGPSAHSFNFNSRQWNTSNNMQYINSVNNSTAFYQMEELSTCSKYNEYIMTRLRTIWGCNLQEIQNYGSFYKEHFQKSISKYIANKQVTVHDNIYRLNSNALLMADGITADLFSD